VLVSLRGPASCGGVYAKGGDGGGAAKSPGYHAPGGGGGGGRIRIESSSTSGCAAFAAGGTPRLDTWGAQPGSPGQIETGSELPTRIAVKPVAASDALSERAALSITAALAAEVQKQRGVEVVRGDGSPDQVVAGESAWDGRNLVFRVQLVDGRGAQPLRVVSRSFEKGTAADVLGALSAMVAELLQPPAAPSSPAAPAVSPAGSTLR
jgi:hypothetical protein